MPKSLGWSSVQVRMSPFKYLLLFLGIPCLALAGVFFWLSCLTSSTWWQGLWLDLGVTSLGIAVTVFYVDRVIQWHESQKWKGVAEIADERLKSAATRLIVTIANRDPNEERKEKYRLGGDVWRSVGEGYLYFRYTDRQWKEYVRNTVLAEIDTFINSFDEEDIDGVLRTLEYTTDDLAEIVATFREVLTPEDMRRISNIQIYMRYARLDHSRLYEGERYDLTADFRNIIEHCLDIIEDAE